MNNKRTLIVVAFAVFFFAVLFFKLFEIQISKHENYDYYAKNQQTRDKILRAERGFIYDRNGELLAYDRSDVSFFVDTRMIAKNKNSYKIIESIAVKFSSVFGKPKSYYLNLLKDSRKNIAIEKKVPVDKAMKLKDFIVDGLFSVEDPTRIYSYDNLASHILGYVNSDYSGSDGIEKYYNKELTGTDGKLLVDRDVRGRMVTVNDEGTVKPVHGKSIYLTIDKNYQAILQEELVKGIEQFQGNSACGIIMDPNNGEILALANLPDFNPNCYWSFPDDSRRNKILTDTYEPGSTFKSITLSSLLDRSLCNENEKVFTENGRYRYKKVNITDSHEHQWLSVREVIEQSSNIGMAKLIPRIDEDNFFMYLRNFGFGNYTSIDLPGETKGKLIKPSDFDDYSQVSMSYGYGVSVTPIQLIAAYSALVNGGCLYQPHIVKKEMTREGQLVKEFEPKMIRQVVKKTTSERIKNILVGVVENGTAKTAKIDNMIIGGKTGTSKQIVDKKYSSQNYNSSFIGFFPAKNPKIICLVVVDAPQVGRYGGMVAGPIFKNIALRLIDYKGDLARDNSAEPEANEIDNVFTTVKNTGEQKNANYPENNKKGFDSFKKQIRKDIMPDLTKKTLRDALSVLTQIGIKCKVTGSGRVVSQSIAPGERIKPGMTCILTCEENKINGVRIN